jgi:hypothetical protein
MNWTTDKPDRDGFYWVRASAESPATIVEIFGFNFRDPRIQYPGLRETDSLLRIDGEWIGPLEVPA